MRLATAAFIVLSLLSSDVNAQWREIADFKASDGMGNQIGEYITCVYFLDLPGPHRIGFVGTESELHKTTDGGKSWRSVWDKGKSFAEYYVTDICFKDSLTGWFSMFGNTDACYRTTDGGETWTQQDVPGSITGALAVHYCELTNLLFLSTSDTGIKVSKDLGNTWELATTLSSGGFSFFSDSVGIVAVYPGTSDTSKGYTGIMRTTDGGLSWHTVETPVWCTQPLTIPGTSICFEADLGNIIIRRSDDYGQTWRVTKNFGPVQDSHFNFIAPSGTGIIQGNLSRLFIQTDSGMYVSMDSGVTWENEGGPSYRTNFSNDRFYSSKGITIAGMTYGNGALFDGGLWEEDTSAASVVESAMNSGSVFSVFPTPATGELQITGGVTGILHLFDVMGCERMNATMDGIRAVMDVSRLPAGLYFLRMGDQFAKVEVVH